MSRAARLTAALPLLAAVAVPVGAASGFALPGTSAPQPARQVVAARLGVVGGTVDGLFPGAYRRVPVEVRNESTRSVRLDRVEGAAQRASAGCSGALLRVDPVSPGRVLRPGGVTVVKVPVQMRRHASDACQGVTFRIALRASGTSS